PSSTIHLPTYSWRCALSHSRDFVKSCATATLRIFGMDLVDMTTPLHARLSPAAGAKTTRRSTPGLPQPLDDVGRRSALDERERDDAPARPLDLLAPVYLFERVVAALREHVGQNLRDERARRLLVEDRHEVHRRERREHFGALALAQHGATRALQSAHRAVAVDGDEQRVPQLPRGFEVAHVPDVQKVEAPVGEDEPPPPRAQILAHTPQLPTIQNHPAAHYRLTRI